MKTYYTNITSKRPEDFLSYSKGWDNRIEDLEHI